MADGEMKRQWPELLGKTVEEAKEVVQAERPDVTIQVMGSKDRETRDYNEERVRIFNDKDDGIVSRPPRCG